MQTDHAGPITLLGLLKGDHEKRLHEHFASLNIRGEWFSFSTEMLQAFGVSQEDYDSSRDFIGERRPSLTSDALLSIGDAAARYGIEVSVIKKLYRGKAIPYVVVNRSKLSSRRTIRFSQKSLDRIFEKSQMETIVASGN